MYTEDDIRERLSEVLLELSNSGKYSSNSQLARSIGMSPQLLNEILKGRNKISLQFLHNLCKTYNLSMDYLVLGIGEKYCHLKLSPKLSPNQKKEEEELAGPPKPGTLTEHIYKELNLELDLVQEPEAEYDPKLWRAAQKIVEELDKIHEAELQKAKPIEERVSTVEQNLLSIIDKLSKIEAKLPQSTGSKKQQH